MNISVTQLSGSAPLLVVLDSTVSLLVRCGMFSLFTQSEQDPLPFKHMTPRVPCVFSTYAISILLI